MYGTGRRISNPLLLVSRQHPYNSQDVVDVQMVTSNDFRAVLWRLNSLMLRVETHEEDDLRQEILT